MSFRYRLVSNTSSRWCEGRWWSIFKEKECFRFAVFPLIPKLFGGEHSSPYLTIFQGVKTYLHNNRIIRLQANTYANFWLIYPHHGIPWVYQARVLQDILGTQGPQLPESLHLLLPSPHGPPPFVSSLSLLSLSQHARILFTSGITRELTPFPNAAGGLIHQ